MEIPLRREDIVVDAAMVQSARQLGHIRPPAMKNFEKDERVGCLEADIWFSVFINIELSVVCV